MMLNLDNLTHRSFIIDNVTVVDPAKSTMFPGHVVVSEGKIEGVERGRAREASLPIYDGRGLHLAPGFVDIHVHLREPGSRRWPACPTRFPPSTTAAWWSSSSSRQR
jgi:dihydroorotase-like cyclic amidohydrolase